MMESFEGAKMNLRNSLAVNRHKITPSRGAAFDIGGMDDCGVSGHIPEA